MKRSMIFLMLICVLLLGTSVQSVSGQNSAKILVNGQELTLDQPPVVVDGRTLVPVRAISEAFGLYISWVGEANTAFIDKGNGKQIAITINKMIAVNEGTDVNLDVPAQIINGRTMVPLRFIGEALGAQVNWDADSGTVSIDTSGSLPNTSSDNLNQQISDNEAAINQAQIEYDDAKRAYNDLKSIYPAYWITGEIVANEGDSLIVKGSAIGNGPGLTEGYIKINNPSKSGMLLYMYTGAHYFIQKEQHSVYKTVTVFGDGPPEVAEAKERLDSAKAKLEDLNGLKQNLQEASAGIMEINHNNGDYYKGTVNSTHQPNGKGKYIWANGSEYDGDWVNGVRSGKGTYKFSNGDYYEGEFDNNLFNGIGSLKSIYHARSSAGSEYYENEYHGGFKDGKYSGGGVLKHYPDIIKYYSNEDFPFSYEGDFWEGQFHGQGILYDQNDNVVFCGSFENGSPVKGTETEPKPVG